MYEETTEPQAELETALVPADETGAAPEAENTGTDATVEAQPASNSEADAEAEKRAKAQAVINKRIAQEVAKRHEAERRAKALEEMIAAKAGTQAEELPTDPAEVRRMIEARAAELAKSQAAQLAHSAAFNERCNEVAAEGSNIPSFKESLANLNAMGVMRPDSDFMQSVVAMKDAAKILAHLGQHPDLASEIADAPVHKMAARLADIASEVNKPPKTSRAPAPVKPINVTASPTKPTKLAEARSDAEWLELRRAQRQARFAR